MLDDEFASTCRKEGSSQEHACCGRSRRIRTREHVEHVIECAAGGAEHRSPKE